MSGPLPKSLFRNLALFVAAGGKVATWCDSNVARGTAHHWYRSDEFQRLVADFRRRAVDRAIGKMAKNLGKAVEKIVKLVEEGESQAIQLSAAKSLIDKLVHVQNHTEVKDELRRLDDRLSAQEKRRGGGPRKPLGIANKGP
jgi:hypothetical protein